MWLMTSQIDVVADPFPDRRPLTLGMMWRCRDSTTPSEHPQYSRGLLVTQGRPRWSLRFRQNKNCVQIIHQGALWVDHRDEVGNTPITEHIGSTWAMIWQGKNGDVPS